MRTAALGPAGVGERNYAVAAAAERLRTDPRARALYQRLQASYVGPDPLGVGACDWLDTLTRGQVLHVGDFEPLLALGTCSASRPGSTRSWPSTHAPLSA